MKRFLCFIIPIVFVFSLCSPCYGKEINSVEFLSYPERAITDFDETMRKRISSGDDYLSNCGYDETGLYISPYWNCEINGKFVPVYASMTYDYQLNTGVLQSFSVLWLDENKSELNVKISSAKLTVNNAVILPEKNNVPCKNTDNSVSFKIDKEGSFTCLINNDNQEFAFTLFVKEYVDENKTIENLNNSFGKENVKVFEKDFYEEEIINTENYKAIYFKRGAYFKAKHIYDIKSEDDFLKLNYRKSFLQISGKENVIVTGCGTFDFTNLDRKEREGVNIEYCKNCIIEGLILLNSPSWTFICYGCENTEIKDITVTGYRTNSDGINICGCNNMTISDSFIRTGDDCFSVKTTNDLFPAHDIGFLNCIAWSTKARCFGITGEVEADIYNVLFKDCSVIFRDATWDNDRAYSLAIAVENGKGQINNVTFENIEIHRDTGRGICVIVYGNDIKNCKIKNITFKNVSLYSDLKNKISTKRNISFLGKIISAIHRFFKEKFPRFKFTKWLEGLYDSSNETEVKFENVFCGEKKITDKNISKYFLLHGNVSTEVL